jgi:hypothetical protein
LRATQYSKWSSAIDQQLSLEFSAWQSVMGWKRVLPKVRYMVLQCNAVQRSFMTFSIVPKAVMRGSKAFGRIAAVTVFRL